VSAITQLNIDADHRFSTSDNRLLRKMVRDYKFRNYSPTETISRWHSVRLGEERNIFPYQDNADFFFNSALIYELPVLAGDVKPLLELIEEGNRFDDQIHRLKTLLSFFIPLEEEIVPGISILREFIGKSEFNY
jgi:uridine kinase